MKRSTFPWLLNIISGQKNRLMASMSLAVLYSLLALVPYILIYRMIDMMVNDRMNSDRDVWILIAGAITAILLKMGLQLLSGLLSHKAAFQLLFELRRKVVAGIGDLPLRECNKHSSAKIKKIIADDIDKIETFVAHHLPDMAAAIISPIGAVLLLFYFDWRLALASLLPLPVAISLQAWMFKGFNQRVGEYHQVVETLHTSVVDFVKTMPVVKAYNITVESHGRYADAVDKYHQLVTDWLMDAKTPGALFKLSLDLGFLIIMPLGIWLYAHNQIEFASLFMFMLLGIGLMEPLNNLLHFGGMFSEMLKGIENMRIFIDTPPQKEGTELQTVKANSISFSKVCFRHNLEDPLVIDNLSFIAEQGQVTALVGPSGAGKTTAAQLVSRFFDYDSGKIEIGGADITQMPLEQLMDLVSFVFQDIFILNDTLYENIRMGNNALTEEDVIKAAKSACAHDFIMELPDKYQSQVSQGVLSGGQAQRIAIARAIAKNSPILILDEATAYADARNEIKIQQAISDLMQGRTVLIIAHRLNTLVDVNKIVVIDKGKKLAEGSHAELLHGSKFYQSMWQAHQSSKQWHIHNKQ